MPSSPSSEFFSSLLELLGLIEPGDEPALDGRAQPALPFRHQALLHQTFDALERRRGVETRAPNDPGEKFEIPGFYIVSLFHRHPSEITRYYLAVVVGRWQSGRGASEAVDCAIMVGY